MPELFANLVVLCERSCARYADRPLYGTKRDGAWHWTTYREFGEAVNRCRAGLAKLGIRAGDRIAFIGNNCVEWSIAAHAAYGLGAAFVPMYEAQRPSEWRFILEDCGARMVIATRSDIFATLCDAKPSLPALEFILGIALPASDPRSFAAVLEAGAKEPYPAHHPDPSVIAGLIYTSGTTGKPKGVMLSHDNIASNISAVHQVFTFEPDDLSLAFLPWAHVYGQTCEVHALMSMGCSTAINDDPDKLIENLAEVKPTILMAVPRIFQRLYSAVREQIRQKPAIVQRVVEAGVRSAIRSARGERLGLLERLELSFDDKMLFAKIREKFGGRLKYAISASATLNHDTAEFIDALGITVYEGYGLTETAPIVSVNFPGHRKMGSIGRVLPGVRVEIDRSVTNGAREGEIVVYGRNVMVGYHNRPEENAKARTADGGFRTGDLGYLDEDGYLFITGRIKEQYKLENGKYVMPSPLEEELKQSRFIANVFLYGDGQPFNVALIAIDNAAVKRWAEENHFSITDPFTDSRVRELFRDEIARHGTGFRAFERPRGFALLREDFTTQNGLLTPTLKLRRKDVVARYKPQITALYEGAREVVANP